MKRVAQFLAVFTAGTLLGASVAAAGDGERSRPSPRVAEPDPGESIQVFGSGARLVTWAVTGSARVLKETVVLEARVERRSTILLMKAWVNAVRGAARLASGFSCPGTPSGEAAHRASRPD